MTPLATIKLHNPLTTKDRPDASLPRTAWKVSRRSMRFLYRPTANQVNTATVVGVNDGESPGNEVSTSAFRRAMSSARDFARMYKRLGVGKPDTGGGDTGEDISTSTQLRT